MRYGLFKVDNVTAPLRLHGQPERWAVLVDGKTKAGHCAGMSMEFQERIHADAVVFGIHKLMEKVDVWLGPVSGTKKEVLCDEDRT